MEAQALFHRLVARLAHDVKNPLSVVNTNLQYLREGISDPAQAEAVEDSLAALTHGIRIIDDLVDLGAIQAGTLRPCRGRFSLAALERPLREEVSALLGRRELVIDLPDRGLETDEVLLRRALGSLLEHGIKHTPGGREITLRASCDPDGLTIEMADGGQPFDPDHPASILLDLPTAKEQPVGYRSDQGVALFFAGVVVRALGGVVKLRPREDQPGAVFQLRFPKEILRHVG
jgi:two-component system sensor histidine kinase KdpD